MSSIQLPSLLEIIQRSLALDPQIFLLIGEAEQATSIALFIVALAGLSEAIGQSLILFINRIRPGRFGLALLLSVGSHMVGFFFWAATIWLISVYVFERSQSPETVVRFVALAYAPQLIAFFVLTPYLGSAIAFLISAWTLLATITAVQIGFEMTLIQAIACSALGWIVAQIGRRTLGRPLLAFERWLQKRTLGRSLRWNLKDLPSLKLPLALRRRTFNLYKKKDSDSDGEPS